MSFITVLIVAGNLSIGLVPPLNISQDLDKQFIVGENVYYKTLNRWKEAYNVTSNSNLNEEGLSYIGHVAGNGEKDNKHRNKVRDTIIFAPVSTSYASPVDLIFWFHGCGGFSTRDFKIRTLGNIGSLTKNNKNFIVIIPEMPWSKNTSTHCSRQGRVFTKLSEFSTFIESTLAIINTHFMNHGSNEQKDKLVINNIMFIGHSAGGSTLKSISKAGGFDWLYGLDLAEKKKLLAIRIIFSDAGYGRWTDTTWNNFKLRSHAEFLFLVRKWDRPYKHTYRFLKRFRGHIPQNIKVIVFNRKYLHGDIGDQALRWAYKSVPSQITIKRGDK